MQPLLVEPQTETTTMGDVVQYMSFRVNQIIHRQPQKRPSCDDFVVEMAEVFWNSQDTAQTKNTKPHVDVHAASMSLVTAQAGHHKLAKVPQVLNGKNPWTCTIGLAWSGALI